MCVSIARRAQREQPRASAPGYSLFALRAMKQVRPARALQEAAPQNAFLSRPRRTQSPIHKLFSAPAPLGLASVGEASPFCGAEGLGLFPALKRWAKVLCPFEAMEYLLRTNRVRPTCNLIEYLEWAYPGSLPVRPLPPWPRSRSLCTVGGRS